MGVPAAANNPSTTLNAQTQSQSSSQSYANNNNRLSGGVQVINNQDHGMRVNELNHQQQQQQQQSISQMRSSINEKRLLVKLLKANNLTSKVA